MEESDYSFDFKLEKESVLIAVRDHPKAQKLDRLTAGKKYSIRVAPKMNVKGERPFAVQLRLAVAKEIKPRVPKGDEVLSVKELIK